MAQSPEGSSDSQDPQNLSDALKHEPAITDGWDNEPRPDPIGRDMAIAIGHVAYMAYMGDFTDGHFPDRSFAFERRVTDGWDRTPRPSPADWQSKIPNGHATYMGDF